MAEVPSDIEDLINQSEDPLANAPKKLRRLKKKAPSEGVTPPRKEPSEDALEELNPQRKGGSEGAGAAPKKKKRMRTPARSEGEPLGNQGDSEDLPGEVNPLRKGASKGSASVTRERSRKAQSEGPVPEDVSDEVIPVDLDAFEETDAPGGVNPRRVGASGLQSSQQGNPR